MTLILLIAGIFILFKGEIAVTKGWVIKGWRARVIGALLAGPLLTSFTLGFGIGVYCALNQIRFPREIGFFIDLGVLAIHVALAFVLGACWGKSPEEWDRLQKQRETTLDIDPNFYSPRPPLDPSNPYQSPFQ